MLSTRTKFVVSEKGIVALGERTSHRGLRLQTPTGCAVDTIGGEVGLGTGSGAARLAAATEEPEDEETEKGDMKR